MFGTHIQTCQSKRLGACQTLPTDTAEKKSSRAVLPLTLKRKKERKKKHHIHLDIVWSAWRVQPDCLKWCNAICPGDTVHCARVPACPLDTGNIPFDFRNKEQWPVRVCAAVWSLWGEEKWQMWRLAVEKLEVVGGIDQEIDQVRHSQRLWSLGLMSCFVSPLRRNHFLFYPSKRLSSYTCSTHVCPLH